MFTRQQYMNQECTHHEYYIQFATSGIRAFVESNYSIDQIRECYSKDQNLNNLGNGWVNRFDAVTRSLSGQIAGVNKKLNGQSVYSLCDGTCAIKAYMLKYAKIK